MVKSSGEGTAQGQRYRGVRMRAWGKWVTEIRLKNTRARLWLGSYATPEQAARAYDVALMCLRGSSACLNFPDSPPPFAPEGLSHCDIQELAAKAGGAAGFDGVGAGFDGVSACLDGGAAGRDGGAAGFEGADALLSDNSSPDDDSRHYPSADDAYDLSGASFSDDDRSSVVNSVSPETPFPASTSQNHPSGDEASSPLPNSNNNSSTRPVDLSNNPPQPSILSTTFGFHLSDFEMLGPFDHFPAPFAGASQWDEITMYDLIAPIDELDDDSGAFFEPSLWDL